MGTLGVHAKCRTKLKIGDDKMIHCPKCEPLFFNRQTDEVNTIKKQLKKLVKEEKQIESIFNFSPEAMNFRFNV